MSRKKRGYAKLYGKYMNTNLNFEKDTFNYFKLMYEQKLRDPNFNIYMEKYKLTQLANRGSVDGYLGMYVLSFISLSTFLLFTSLEEYILLRICLAILILFTGIFLTSIIMRRLLKTNVWNIALIALDAACNEKAIK